MIVYLIYLVMVLWLIRHNRFFGLFKDAHINSTQLRFLFFVKALAVPAFYLIYQKLYGGIDNFDAGKFYRDSLVINHYAYHYPGHYLRLLFGFQNDAPGSFDYVHCLVKTQNWDHGTIKDYLYNDNRVLIRLHSVINFFVFDAYAGHALVDCFLSFVGLFFIYKSLATYLKGYEWQALFVLCLFPSLWFYTGGLLKEGFTVFLLGASLLCIQRLFSGSTTWVHWFWMAVLIYLDILLKPYVLLFGSGCFALFFLLDKIQVSPLKFPLFMLALFLGALLANQISVQVKHRSLTEAAFKHQRLFAGVAQGGIFLEEGDRYVRIGYDTSLVKKVEGQDSLFTIRKNTPFQYWVNRQNNDTLVCKGNEDTLTVYKLVYQIPPSRSNLPTIKAEQGVFKALLSTWYYSLMHPFFVNAGGLMQWLASFENLGILLALVYIGWRLLRGRKPAFFPLVCVFFCLAVCVLISVSAPNSGAIIRYRSLVVVFLFLAALYFKPKVDMHP